MDISSQLFADPRSDDAAALAALSQLPSDTPPSLLRDVATSPSYSAFRRGLAVHRLVRNYLRRNATLAELSSLVGGGASLRDAIAERIEASAGEIPVVVPENGAAFIIHVRNDHPGAHPDLGFYLALDHTMRAEEFHSTLMAPANHPSLARTRITDIAVFPDDPAHPP